MDSLFRPIDIRFEHRVIFTRGVFRAGNDALAPWLGGKAIAFVDAGVAAANAGLCASIENFFREASDRSLVRPAVVLPGGESCKNDWRLVETIWEAINDAGIDRHSTVLAIGGGAFLDLVGFAAATAHRGIRLVRMPTTTLSQGDGGVGVKNGVNCFGKKNWVGTFAVPWAVVCDFELLESLPAREKRAGLIEGLKVALLCDREFFERMESMGPELAALDPGAVEALVRRSAQLHVEHIVGAGDPFELGSARPLDFGHWVAHRLEPASDYRIKHGEAVAIGMAVDLVYARRSELLAATECERILGLMERIGFTLFDDELERTDAAGRPLILRGLEEFREHLGGELTITLVTGIGSRIEVHEIDHAVALAAMAELRERSA